MTANSDPQPDSASGRTQPDAPPGLDGQLWLARGALFWEKLWPGLWPALGVTGLFLALALFDLLPGLPLWLHRFARQTDQRRPFASLMLIEPGQVIEITGILGLLGEVPIRVSLLNKTQLMMAHSKFVSARSIDYPIRVDTTLNANA
jgi:hypothetical protein